MSCDPLEVTVFGRPVGAARPRVTSRGTYMPRVHREWMQRACKAIAAEVERRQWVQIEGPAHVVVMAMHQRPKRLIPRRLGGTMTAAAEARELAGAIPYPTTKPDLDNVVKIVQDALVSAGAIADDRYIVEIEAHACYADADMDPRVAVELAPLPQ